jgi:hypothetical protein
MLNINPINSSINIIVPGPNTATIESTTTYFIPKGGLPVDPRRPRPQPLQP